MRAVNQRAGSSILHTRRFLKDFYKRSAKDSRPLRSL
nr:MAG TPA: hypothetical protein [Caudoviricetes sp.]